MPVLSPKSAIVTLCFSRSADIAQRGLTLHQSFPKTMYALMYHDLAKGRPMERDSLSGYIVRQGRTLGVPTPVHELAYLALKPYLDGTPKPLLT
jgi:2-dehydropantoate 2-reductase